MPRGKTIVFEGLDSSGKETQAKLLEMKLSYYGYSVSKISFPSYSNNQHAEKIKKYLNGKIKLSGEELAKEFANDRFMYKEKMEELLNKNDFLIIDRYVYSNIAYQSAKDKITSLVKLIRFTSKIENYEFEKLQLPAIDYLIFLNMRHYNCVKLMKNREKDINENDSYFLSEVYSNYRLIIATIEHKIKTLSVKCQSESDDIFSPEKISSEIFDFLSLGRKNV